MPDWKAGDPHPEAAGHQGSPLQQLVAAMVDGAGFSAAVALVGSGGGILAQAAAGARRLGPGARLIPTDRFDLASLTKPFVGSLALVLDAAGELSLDLALGELWPRVDPRLAERPLRTLLSHRAGLRPWAPLYRLCREVHEVGPLLLGGELMGAPEGTYSDLDFILWGLSAECALERPLGELLQRRLGAVLGADLLGRPGALDCVECRLDNAREIELAAAQGVVVPAVDGVPPGTPQDGNARFLGGVAGHAGLFGSAETVWRMAREWLDPGVWLERRRTELGLRDAPYALGWARPASWQGGEGTLSPAGWGHLGFTGGSVWVEPRLDRVAVLLAHRVTTAVDPDLWRRRFHRLAFATDGW